MSSVVGIEIYSVSFSKCVPVSNRYNYGCVIYGWDPVCKMDELWIQQMGVDRSPNGRNQPFYNVLGNDSSTRYAAHGMFTLVTF